MHHGTILYDSNLDILSQALKVENEKIESKAVKSVKSRVTNIRPYMITDMSTSEFWSALKKKMILIFDMQELILASEHHAATVELTQKVYSQWNWNYGNSPPYTMRKARRFDKCGKIEVLLDMEKEGIIRSVAFFGDFFGNLDPGELEDTLAGQHLEYFELQAALNDVDISQYFHALDTESFLALLLE